MIEDYSSDLLRTGIIELKAGNRATARRYIDRALYMTGDHDVLAEGWYWMSLLADSPTEKREALENCLSHDLHHARARRALAVLDGRLKPDDVIDPDAAITEAPGTAFPAAERFMCPRCGARMHFAADGQSLVCDHCTGQQTLQREEARPGASAEKDFLVAMATAQGHGRPLAEQVFVCKGCGAQFFLPPTQLTVDCPYCASPHVVSFEKSADLIAPDALIPHAFDQARASSILERWLRQKLDSAALPPADGFPAPHGLYLPAWVFDLGGVIDYTGELTEAEGVAFGRRATHPAPVSGSYPSALLSLPVPASRKLSAPFVRLLSTYDLASLQPYDPRYLADWPAELYDIPLAEASLDARSQGYAMLKRDMVARLGPVRILSTSSAGLVVDSFRLVLLPAWTAEVTVDERRQLVLVNGQTGDVYGDIQARPSHSGNILSWLADLIGE